MVEQVRRPETQPQPQLEAQLETELASFASLSANTDNSDVHPDQLDLLTPIDNLAHLDDFDHDPQENQ